MIVRLHLGVGSDSSARTARPRSTTGKPWRTSAPEGREGGKASHCAGATDVGRQRVACVEEMVSVLLDKPP